MSLAPRDNRLVKVQPDCFPNLFNLPQISQTNVVSYDPAADMMGYQSIASLVAGTTTTGTLVFGNSFIGSVDYSLYTMIDGTKQLTLLGQPQGNLTKLNTAGLAVSQSIAALVPSTANQNLSVVLIGYQNTGIPQTGKLYMAQVNQNGQVSIGAALAANNALAINENFNFLTSMLVYK